MRFLALTLALASTQVFAQAHKPPPMCGPEPQHICDLADAVQGQYMGDVISDSKGASQSGVAVVVIRVGLNMVQVNSDYPRLPVIRVPLTKAMDKILQRNGDSVFLWDPVKRTLDISFLNEVSWSGQRE